MPRRRRSLPQRKWQLRIQCSSSSATTAHDLTLAMSSGVLPPSSARSTSAPLSSSSRAASTWPLRQAMNSGRRSPRPPDRPPRRFPATAAPRRRGPPGGRRRTAASSRRCSPGRPPRLSPAAAGRWPTGSLSGGGSGVNPRSAARSTSAPLSSSSRAASTWPFTQAMNSGDHPVLVRPIDLRAVLQQQPQRQRVARAALAGGVQRRLAPLITVPGEPPVPPLTAAG